MLEQVTVKKGWRNGRGVNSRMEKGEERANGIAEKSK